jgi:hypothetical protein
MVARVNKTHGVISDSIIKYDGTLVLLQMLACSGGGSLPGDFLKTYVGNFCYEASLGAVRSWRYIEGVVCRFCCVLLFLLRIISLTQSMNYRTACRELIIFSSDINYSICKHVKFLICVAFEYK